MNLRVTWNNTWRTMTLVRCGGGHSGALLAIAAACNATAENPNRATIGTPSGKPAASDRAGNIDAVHARQRKCAGDQHLPSIKAMMRSVRRRAGGMMRNAVAAATGQAI
jgi:hypothetical protein